jgi:hypothetical protein
MESSKKITSLNIFNNPKLSTKSILENKIKMILYSNNPMNKNSNSLSKLTLLKKLRSKIINTESNIIKSPQNIFKNQKLKNIKLQKNLINKTINSFQKENTLINNNSSNFRESNPFLPLNNFTKNNYKIPLSLTGNNTSKNKTYKNNDINIKFKKNIIKNKNIKEKTIDYFQNKTSIIQPSLIENRKINLSPEIIENYNSIVQNIINSNNNINLRSNQLNKIKVTIENSNMNNASKSKLISKINSVQQMFYQMF